MNEMYEYLEEHAYISKNKKSNYQFELTKERAECIANKHNSLVEEKDKEIERLNRENEELKKIQCTFLGTGCKAEIERQHSIIKEAIEYIENNTL